MRGINKTVGTVFNNDSMCDGLGASGLRGGVYKALRGEMQKKSQNNLFAQASERQKNPSDAEKWFFANWAQRGGERFLFVTDFWVCLVRNLGTPYIIELDLFESDEKRESYRRHMVFKRKIPTFFIKPFDNEALQLLRLQLDKDFA